MTDTEKEQFLTSGFSKEQIAEIEEGQKEGLNTSIYENKEFLAIQMRQIRLGLMERLPVEQYAKLEYDWFQMEEIREGLKSGIDITLYAMPEIPYEKMRQVRKGLEAGENLSGYLNKSAGVIREIRRARRAKVDILSYVEQGYDAEQLSEIRQALEIGINLNHYLSKEYRAASIAEICIGLKHGVDVSCYASIRYSWRQMREIRKGLENRIAVEKYKNQLYSWEQMKEIRLGLEQGLDVEEYRLLRYTAGEMHKKRQAILNHVPYEQKENAESQIKAEDFVFQISENGMEAYVTVQPAAKKITAAKLLEILKANGICKGVQKSTVEKIINGTCGDKAILIARGKEPSTGEDGWYEFFFRTDLEKKPKILEDGSVDYQNIERFEMVQAGQKLAYYHAAKEGTDGYTVTGEPIKARKGIEKKILVGKGFQLEEDKLTYTALISGMITLEENEMRVNSHMVLDEVTAATGNVTFNGSIHILGDVGAGTIIKAADDIVIDGHVEAATIESGGNVVLKKGMNAAGGGQISAEKNVVSRFFESVRVMAKGNIEVDKCLNSQLYARKMIISSRVIAGGISQAERGFQINHAGNQAGIHTVMKLKVDDKVLEEHKQIMAGIRDVKNELQMLENAYVEFELKLPPEIRNNAEVFKKLEKALFTKKKQLEQLTLLEQGLEQEMKVVKESKIQIRGWAHEGVVLEIDGSRWQADERRNITVKKSDSEVEVLTN